MAWLGVPFPDKGVGFLDSGIVTLASIPKIVVDSGFSWDSLISSFIAGLIPGVIAWYTIRRNLITLREDRKNQQESFDRDRDAQLNIATKNLNAQVLSSNRQLWINSLRDTVSGYLAAINSARKSITICRRYKLEGSSDVLFANETSLIRMFDDIAKVEELSFKIRLLINPIEPEAKEIDRLIKELKLSTGNLKISPKRLEIIEYSDQMIEVTQKYLKKEWERVKAIS